MPELDLLAAIAFNPQGSTLDLTGSSQSAGWRGNPGAQVSPTALQELPAGISDPKRNDAAEPNPWYLEKRGTGFGSAGGNRR
jgi:hypothetical protein